MLSSHTGAFASFHKQASSPYLREKKGIFFLTDDNLCGLNHQLQNPTVNRIAEFLLISHSTYARQFLTLKDEIEDGVTEAKSNIEYLRILLDPSAELDQCVTPSNIEEHLMLIIHLFRTIWLNSPFYNSHERIENLFRALNNQIIIICRNYIDLNELFAGKTRSSIETLEECVNVCENYKSLYDKVNINLSICTEYLNQKWTDSNILETLFSRISVF